MPVVRAEPPVMTAEIVGAVHDRDLLDALFTGRAQLADRLVEHMASPLPMVGAGEPVQAAMVALEKTGVLRSSTRGSDDVTTQVIDTGVRVRAQEASLKRVELLLAEARSLKDIIWIESQLTTRQAELDSMKSQQSWLEDQTSFSTITVDITAIAETKKVEKKEEEQEAGFLVGLQGGMKALGASASAIATVATIAYSGFLVGPPLIGTVASATGLDRALWVVLALTAGIFLLAGNARSVRDTPATVRG